MSKATRKDTPALNAADVHDLIRVQGARVNNLKDVSVELPKRRLTVFTGVSGSGVRNLPSRPTRPQPSWASLEFQRATLAWTCAGLDAAGLRATAAASSITLGGLLKHLAQVEGGVS